MYREGLPSKLFLLVMDFDGEKKSEHFMTLPEAVQVGDLIQLTDAEGFHLSKVLRIQNNDSIEILNGKESYLPENAFEVLRNNLKVMVKQKKIIPASSPQFHIGARNKRKTMGGFNSTDRIGSFSNLLC